MGAKYANYSRHPSVQHYLIVFMEDRLAVLHSRGDGEMLKSRIAKEGEKLTIDPPGLDLAVSDFFAGLDGAFAD